MSSLFRRLMPGPGHPVWYGSAVCRCVLSLWCVGWGLLSVADAQTTRPKPPVMPAKATTTPAPIPLPGAGAGPLSGQSKGKLPSRTHQINAKDYFSINYVWDVVVSPKGRFLAYVESRWGKKSRNADLWVMDLQTRQKTRLTFHKAADTSPQWGASGQWIYFATRREATKGEPTRGKRQVWRIRRNGDRLMPVTQATKGVAGFQLSRDGKQLYFQTNHRKVQKGPFVKLRKQFPKLKYGHNAIKTGQIWALDLENWRTRRLVKLKRSINSFSVSPDGTRVALLTAPDRQLISNEGWSRLDIYDLQTGKLSSPEPRQWRQDAPSPYGWLSHLTWASNGQRLAFRVGFDGYPAEVYVLSLQGAKVTASVKLKRHLEAHMERSLGWQPGTQHLCYLATRLARSHLYCASFAGGQQGKTEIVPGGDANAYDFAFSADGRIMATAMMGLDFPSDLWFGDAVGARTRLIRATHLNPQVDTWKLPSTRLARWKSKDGTAVEGVLELPPGVAKKPKKPLPLLVILHGGPTAAAKRQMQFGYQGRTLYAARGWATLSPNYRGSTGYGDKFLIDLIGHKNDRDIDDIMSGVDAMIKRGIADPKRMAIVGWSNGGYLVNCLITKTTRFKAASSGAGVFDTAMQWMIEDTPGHVINYNRGLPWQRQASMSKSSPLYQIHKARTPTIIHVGERDARVPVEHSRALYRSLRRYLHVPTQLIVYPGVFHGLRSRKHRAAKIQWDMQWFDHYVLQKHRQQKKKRRPRRKPVPPVHAQPPKGLKAS